LLPVAPVASHHRRPANQDLADLARAERSIVAAGDADLGVELRRADRSQPRVVVARNGVVAIHRRDRHRRFALPVDLRKARAKRGEGRLGVGDVHGPAAVDDALQPVEPRVTYGGRGDQSLHDRRRRKEAGPIPGGQQRADFVRIEAARFRHDVHRAMCHKRHQIEARAVRAAPGGAAHRPARSFDARDESVIAWRLRA
jgi:hypothetical protein